MLEPPMTMQEPPPHATLVEMFESAVSKHADRPLFGTRQLGQPYSWVSYADVGARVDALRGGLAGAGVEPGAVVGMIANNSVEWAVVAFATYGRQARLVPMYLAELEATWRYIVADSGISLLFVATSELAERLAPWVDEIPCLERIVCLEGDGPDTLVALEGQGVAAPVGTLIPDPDDIALLIYTSGTTAEPKGVLLSHGNLASNSWAGYRRFPELDETGSSLSILPWAHSYGQTGELNCFLQFGGSLAFMTSVATLAEDFLEARPTYLLAVPRILNRIHDGVQAQMRERGGVAKALFDMGLNAARQRRQAQAQGRQDLWASARFHIADAVVFSKIRKRFGGRLLGVLSGSATLNPDVCWFFHDVGIPAYDCYGLTETSPAVTMNSTLGFKPGTVGRPVDGVRVVIDRSLVDQKGEDGEVVVYGPNVMKGYHDKPEQTAAVMTDDGGFRTGDRGVLDDDGYLRITGRIKEQYKLENGKYVFPAALEEDIRRVPGIANAVVYGEGRPFNVCLIVPDLPALEHWAAERRLDVRGEEMLERAIVLAALGAEVEVELRKKYGGYEVPKRWAWLQQDLSVEDGTLTQTMKLKRRVVYERYAGVIEDLYRSPGLVAETTPTP
jgi:long-chain acyl-CoA synthetase